MAEIRFYHTQHKAVQDVLPDLLVKALSRQMRVVCKLASDDECQEYDDYLWQFSKTHFLPHGKDNDAFASEQPVLLTTGDAAANNAKTMMVLDETPLPPNGQYDLVCYIFDGRNAIQVQRARSEWTRLKQDSNVILTYWQQQDNGQWQNKA